MESPFFGNEGLTSTSANHIANIAKNWYEALEDKLNNLVFYQTTLKLIGNTNEEIINNGTNPEDFKQIDQYITDIALAKSLIAWLREAIKYKDRLTVDVKNLTVKNYCEQHNLDPLVFPTCKKYITEEEYLDSLSVKERQRYYTIQTCASTIGKFVHPNGGFAKAREDLNKIIREPITTSTNGRDTLIYKRNPQYPIEAIDSVFFKLQKEQREYQAEFNSMQHKVEQAIEKDTVEKELEYRKALEEYKIRESELQSAHQEWIREQQSKIKALKIVIPDNLRSIYEKINKLGK